MLSLLSGCCEPTVEQCDAAESGASVDVEVRAAGRYTITVSDDDRSTGVICDFPDGKDCEFFDHGLPASVAVEGAHVHVRAVELVEAGGGTLIVGPPSVDVTVEDGSGVVLADTVVGPDWPEQGDRCGTCGPSYGQQYTVE